MKGFPRLSFMCKALLFVLHRKSQVETPASFCNQAFLFRARYTWRAQTIQSVLRDQKRPISDRSGSFCRTLRRASLRTSSLRPLRRPRPAPGPQTLTWTETSSWMRCSLTCGWCISWTITGGWRLGRGAETGTTGVRPSARWRPRLRGPLGSRRSVSGRAQSVVLCLASAKQILKFSYLLLLAGSDLCSQVDSQKVAKHTLPAAYFKS